MKEIQYVGPYLEGVYIVANGIEHLMKPGDTIQVQDDLEAHGFLCQVDNWELADGSEYDGSEYEPQHETPIDTEYDPATQVMFTDGTGKTVVISRQEAEDIILGRNVLVEGEDTNTGEAGKDGE